MPQHTEQLTIQHIRPPKDTLLLRLGAISIIIVTVMIMLNTVKPHQEEAHTVEVASVENVQTPSE